MYLEASLDVFIVSQNKVEGLLSWIKVSTLILCSGVKCQHIVSILDIM